MSLDRWYKNMKRHLKTRGRDGREEGETSGDRVTSEDFRQARVYSWLSDRDHRGRNRTIC